jgi:hypothetical protein
MSYCRSNGKDSDTYVIGTRDFLECFGIGWREKVQPEHEIFMADSWTTRDDKIVKTGGQHEAVASFTTNSRQEMIDHLLKHREAGHLVPDYAIERLREEIELEGDKYESII